LARALPAWKARNMPRVPSRKRTDRSIWPGRSLVALTTPYGRREPFDGSSPCDTDAVRVLSHRNCPTSRADDLCSRSGAFRVFAGCARSADLYCRLGFTRRRSGSVVAGRRRCGRPRTVSRKPRRSTRTQSIRRRSRPRMQPRWRRKRGGQLPTSRRSCRRSVATWRCRTSSAQLPEGPERRSAMVRLQLAAPGSRHTHCPLRPACACWIAHTERPRSRSADLASCFATSAGCDDASPHPRWCVLF
jgi:hypothetical protein